MLEKEIVLLNVRDVSNQDEAIEKLVRKLLDAEVVKNSYLPAIMKREQEYPTGLLVENEIGIAIPHTDAEHVLENQIAVMTLSEPVNFKQMADISTIVPVDIIFMLALKESDSQLSILQKLMMMGQDVEALEKLLASSNKKEALEVIKSGLEL